MFRIVWFFHQVQKNKVKFIIDGAFFATLISRPQYTMFHVERHPKAECKSMLEEIRTIVHQTVVETLETVISQKKYKPYECLLATRTQQPFQLAFHCCLEDSHSDHLMIIAKDVNGRCATCLESSIILKLEDQHLIRFKVSILAS